MVCLIGCPKNPDSQEECSNHGSCDSATHICECEAGWVGVACHEPWCPGEGNCFGRGFCNPNYTTPKCEECQSDWMGPDCNTPCVNGIQVSLQLSVIVYYLSVVRPSATTYFMNTILASC